MAANYKYNTSLVASYLDKAHSTNASQLRQDLFRWENALLTNLVKGKNTLIVWSWLWHDSFTLAPFAAHITWIEIIPEFVDIANSRLGKTQLHNISFLQWDIMTFKPSAQYDVVVLNMWTIWNFDDKKAVIEILLGLWNTVVFWFWDVHIDDVSARLEMYKIEWGKFAVDWTTIKELESWMESTCTSKEEISYIAEVTWKKVVFNNITHSYYLAIIQ